MKASQANERSKSRFREVFPYETRERFFYGGKAVAIFLTPLFVGQLIVTLTVDLNDIFNDKMVKFSLLVDMALLFCTALFIAANVLTKQVGERATKFHYWSAIVFMIVLAAAALTHMHLLGTLHSMQTVLIMAVNVAFFWYVRRRDAYIFFALSNLAILVLLALELYGVIPYAPFLANGAQLGYTFLDPRMIIMNGAIYFVIAGTVVSVFLYYRQSLELNHRKLFHLQAELEKHNRHLQALVNEQVAEISESQMAAILALAKLAESRDEETGRHIERVQSFCRILAEKLSEKPKYKAVITPEFIDNLYHASPLHDIGKVGIEDRYLRKSEKLTAEEFNIMRKHTILGAETLQAVRANYPRNAFINMGIEVARNHHERWDGNGYPDGLSREKIPLSARIMAVADVYDALRSKRAYKEPISHDQSLIRIDVESGSHFDPDVVSALLESEKRCEEIWAQMSDQN